MRIQKPSPEDYRAAGSKWVCMDLDSGMLQVKLTMSGAHTERIVEEIKSCKGRRIDHSPTVAEALRPSRAHEAEATGGYEDHEPLFPSGEGNSTNSKNLYYRGFKPLLRGAGSRIWHFASYVTRALQLGS